MYTTREDILRAHQNLESDTIKKGRLASMVRQYRCIARYLLSALSNSVEDLKKHGVSGEQLNIGITADELDAVQNEDLDAFIEAYQKTTIEEGNK